MLSGVLQPPKAESVNGVLVGYRLYYRQLQHDTSPQEPKAAGNHSASRAEITGGKPAAPSRPRFTLISSYTLCGDLARLDTFVGFLNLFKQSVN